LLSEDLKSLRQTEAADLQLNGGNIGSIGSDSQNGRFVHVMPEMGISRDLSSGWGCAQYALT
jgi:hypothetical protein